MIIDRFGLFQQWKLPLLEVSLYNRGKDECVLLLAAVAQKGGPGDD